jgi:hypothetical protein
MENHSQTTMVGGPINAHEFLRKPDFDGELNTVIRKNGALKYITKDRVKEETAVFVETEVRKQIARIERRRERHQGRSPKTTQNHT